MLRLEDNLVKLFSEASSGQQAASVSEKVAACMRKTLQLLEDREAYALKMTSPCSSILQEIEEFTENHNWIQVHTEGSTKGRLRRAMLSGAMEGEWLWNLPLNMALRRPQCPQC